MTHIQNHGSLLFRREYIRMHKRFSSILDLQDCSLSSRVHQMQNGPNSFVFGVCPQCSALLPAPDCILIRGPITLAIKHQVELLALTFVSDR